MPQVSLQRPGWSAAELPIPTSQKREVGHPDPWQGYIGGMRALVLIAALAFWGVADAQAPPAQQPLSSDPGVAAAQAWIGRALLLRGSYLGAELEYDAAGHVKGAPKTTDWTLAGMDVQTVTRRPAGELELDGVRVVIGYNQNQHAFERHPQKDTKLKVLVPGTSDPARVDTELAAVFSQGIDPAFQRALPSWWSHYFLPQQPWPDDELKSATIIGANGKVPVDIVMPYPEKKPEPESTPEARAARVKGTVQATMVVDTTGIPHRVVLRNPLGYGLDEQVAAILLRYRFKPGTLAGALVTVQVIVNQAFD